MVLMVVFVLGIYLIPIAVLMFCQESFSHWQWSEAVCLLVPFLVWFCLSLYGSKAQSLCNAVIEPFIVGMIGCLPIAFKLIANKVGRRSQAIFYLGLFTSCLCALAIYAVVPPLPE